MWDWLGLCADKIHGIRIKVRLLPTGQVIRVFRQSLQDKAGIVPHPLRCDRFLPSPPVISLSYRTLHHLLIEWLIDCVLTRKAQPRSGLKAAELVGGQHQTQRLHNYDAGVQHSRWLKNMGAISGALAKWRKATIRFVASVCSSAWKKSALTGWIITKFYIWVFLENISGKLKLY